ncbi:GNAT family N-acetyltransferase [Massilia forsythiae]|uniref:GNAT family N-acetyltransferase n=1 Tax=Massilia forsythiae TaxID=2728020 RepID=A0A7Z2W061_9BURK|nr:GNAT family N-acetyltransferase [Massilia forsythiae]QJE02708.1 GNAT family N-acetyltransferase [Massilia forsythiae]
MKIQKLDARAVDAALPQLAQLLLDAVGGGASLGFLSGIGADEADDYWRGVRGAVADGARVLLAAVQDGALLGSVQLDLCRRPDGSHRAEVQKLMVHRRARRRGIGSVLLRAVEAEARALQRGLLCLDTEAGCGAEHLVHDLGYTRVGEVPGYAATPGGQLRPSAIYYKSLLVPELA